VKKKQKQKKKKQKTKKKKKKKKTTHNTAIQPLSASSVFPIHFSQVWMMLVMLGILAVQTFGRPQTPEVSLTSGAIGQDRRNNHQVICANGCVQMMSGPSWNEKRLQDLINISNSMRRYIMKQDELVESFCASTRLVNILSLVILCVSVMGTLVLVTNIFGKRFCNWVYKIFAVADSSLNVVVV